MDPEHTPSRGRIEQTPRRWCSKLLDAKGFEGLCNPSGIICPKYVTFDGAYARPSPSGELILNHRLHRPHESIMSVDCYCPSVSPKAGTGVPHSGTMGIVLEPRKFPLGSRHGDT